jgi:hypothetical protein
MGFYELQTDSRGQRGGTVCNRCGARLCVGES